MAISHAAGIRPGLGFLDTALKGKAQSTPSTAALVVKISPTSNLVCMLSARHCSLCLCIELVPRFSHVQVLRCICRFKQARSKRRAQPFSVWPTLRQTLSDSLALPTDYGERARRRLHFCQASADRGTPSPEERDFFVENEGAVRTLPLVAGGIGGLLVVLNRALSGVAAVADASSAQSRADVLVLVLAATLLLTGLVWRSIQSRPTVSVELEGVPCLRVNPSLPEGAKDELLWAWDLLQRATRCRALVVIYRHKVALQAGTARVSEGTDEPASIDVSELVRGKISAAVLRAGRANYFANLALFPGRFEFLGFLPENTQGLIVQPLGDEGLLLAATDTVRGFVPRDQAWIATLAEKLDTTLQDWEDANGRVVEEGNSQQTLSTL